MKSNEEIQLERMMQLISLKFDTMFALKEIFREKDVPNVRQRQDELLDNLSTIEQAIQACTADIPEPWLQPSST